MRLATLWALFATLILAACAPTAPLANGPAAPDGRAEEIVGVLQRSAEAWNRGELDGFLLPYADGSPTTYVGRSGLLRGKPAIRDSYARSYFGSGAPEAMLGFRDIEVRPLGPDHALAVGRYLLRSRGTGTQTAEGIFSLVFTRTGEGWRIVHDHSS